MGNKMPKLTPDQRAQIDKWVRDFEANDTPFPPGGLDLLRQYTAELKEETAERQGLNEWLLAALLLGEPIQIDANTPGWKYYDDMGAYYLLWQGALWVMPADANGLMDASDPLEVEFDNIDADVAERCRQIKAELEAK